MRIIKAGIGILCRLLMPKTDGVCSRADERMYEMKVKMKAQRTD